MTMIYLWLSMTIYDYLVHLFFSNGGVLPSPPTRWVSGGAAETASAWSQARSHMDEGTWKNRPENRSKPWTHSGWWFFALPLWKMMEWVTVGMIFPNTWKINMIANHQPAFYYQSLDVHFECFRMSKKRAFPVHRISSLQNRKNKISQGQQL